jgi:hypothetical protein
MKWWVRLKQLQRHRWLPFFLPVVGTLLYIALALLAIPSDLRDKSDSDVGEPEKPANSAKRVRGAELSRQLPHAASTPTTRPSALPAPPGNP